MSLFSDDPNLAPVDKAREQLLDVMNYAHEALATRADLFRSIASNLDNYDVLLQSQLSGIVETLAASLRDPEDQDQPAGPPQITGATP